MPHAISDHTRPLLGPLWLLRCRASQPVVQAEALATSQENTKWRERHDDAGERSINGFVSVILAMLTLTAREPFLFTYYNHNTVRSVRRHSDTSAACCIPAPCPPCTQNSERPQTRILHKNLIQSTLSCTSCMPITFLALTIPLMFCS